MTAIKDFEEDIIAVEHARSAQLPMDSASDIEQLLERLRPRLDSIGLMLEGGRRDDEALERMSTSLWDALKERLIKAAKVEAAAQRRLAPLYAYLESAGEAEWEEYARLRHRASIDSPTMGWLLERFARRK
jgi:hypothetical protein